MCFYSTGKKLFIRIKKPQIKSAAGNLLSPDENDRIGRTAENLVFIRIKRIKKAAAQDCRSLKVDTKTEKSCQLKGRKAISQDMEIDAADKKRCFVISCAFVFLMCVASFLSYFVWHKCIFTIALMEKDVNPFYKKVAVQFRPYRCLLRRNSCRPNCVSFRKNMPVFPGRPFGIEKEQPHRR